MAKKNYVTIASSNEQIIAALAELDIAVAKKFHKNRAFLIRKAEQAKIWAQVKKSVVPDSYKVEYGAPQNCGDDLAEILKEAAPTPLDVNRIGSQNNIDVEARWGGKNNGMRRMNLGNVLRGMVRRGEYVRIDGVTWNDGEQSEEAAA